MYKFFHNTYYKKARKTNIRSLFILSTSDCGYTERESIASSNFTFNTDEHPELDLLTAAGQKYGQDHINPFTGSAFIY